MAAVLESIIIPRCSSSRTVNSSPLMASCSSVSKLRSLPEFNGLKIQLKSSKHTFASLSSRNLRIVRKGSGIVCESQDTAIEVASVTDGTWDSLVLKANVPVLVEFWAPWCGPCRMIHPVIDELAKQYAGKLKCYKLNTDESPATATQYGIRSIPTVMIFKDGEKKEAVIGAVPKSSLTTSIEKFV